MVRVIKNKLNFNFKALKLQASNPLWHGWNTKQMVLKNIELH